MDPVSIAAEARSFLRPPGWRGAAPEPGEVGDCLLFERNRRAASFDGTQIAYDVYGAEGPWVVLVPGFCCPDNFWRYLLPALQQRHRVAVYDLRGLGLSGTPRPPGYRARNLTPEDFSIPNQVRDIEAVLDAEGIRSAALVGHSMGGQIILEAYRQAPGRVSALVSLTAPYESPMRTFYGRDVSGLFRGVRTALNLLPRPAMLLWRAALLANPSLTHLVAQLSRALGPEAKLEDMACYYRHLAYLDPLVILKMAESMRAHSAADVLPTVRVPTLVVAAALDTFTPVALAQAMKETIPGAELVVVEGAGHGAVIEKPDQVNAAVLSFLGRRVSRRRSGR